jgi:glycosyltransferase involved in cell wall biosynthesis
LGDLKQEAKKLKIDHAVIFTGHLPRAKALELVTASDIGISPISPNPIHNQSSPTKIIEYMLLGKPVVANDIPDQMKIIRESKSGYCVKWDENAFAESIIAIFQDPEAAKKMGQRGIEYVLKNRNYKNIADNVDSQYINLLS